MGSFAVAPASAGITSVEDETETIERTHRIALAYIDNLPNFICTQENRVFWDNSADGFTSRLYSKVVAEARSSDKRESYLTISVDGRPSNQEFKFVSNGAGQFGSHLHKMFRPENNAVLTPTDDVVVHGREVYVFDLVLPKRHYGPESIALGWDSSGMPIRQIAVGSQGSVSIEEETGNVLRIESHEALGIPLDYPVRQSSYRIDYGYMPIGDGTYLLPVRQRHVMRMLPPYLYRYDVGWRDCHRFDTESVLSFDSK